MSKLQVVRIGFYISKFGIIRKFKLRNFHESLDNLTLKDVYLGQGEKIKKIREIIKQNSINKRIFDNKKGNIRVNNYICSCTLSFDNVHIDEKKKHNGSL